MDDFIFPLGIRIYFDTQLQFVQLTADIKQDGFGLNLYIPNQYIDQLEGLSPCLLYTSPSPRDCS